MSIIGSRGPGRGEGRGIYRLARFPTSDDGQYVRWALWSRNRQGVPQGVILHQTAPALFDLSDLMPDRIHMTVPPGFRRNSALPEVLILHRGKLTDGDVEVRQGYCVTRQLRAVADLLDAPAVSLGHLRQAQKARLGDLAKSEGVHPFTDGGVSNEVHSKRTRTSESRPAKNRKQPIAVFSGGPGFTPAVLGGVRRMALKRRKWGRGGSPSGRALPGTDGGKERVSDTGVRRMDRRGGQRGQA